MELVEFRNYLRKRKSKLQRRLMQSNCCSTKAIMHCEIDRIEIAEDCINDFLSEEKRKLMARSRRAI